MHLISNYLHNSCNKKLYKYIFKKIGVFLSMKTSCIIKFLIYIAVSYIFCKYKNFIYIYIYESIYIEGIIGTRNLIFLPMYRLVV